MTAIEEMAGMDVLCSDKTGTLTLNKLTVDKTLVEVHILPSLNLAVVVEKIGPHNRPRTNFRLLHITKSELD